MYLGTDPLKADTDENGINDGDEDLDKDGLTNIKECELGTDPNTADTDGDGLSDGAEANTYGTDPLKYDTDGDNVSDGDEITLGLDPNSSSTDGIPDSERTFTQTVSSDSEVLSAVNDNKETPFKVSLEMKAAGVAENNVYARESGYSNAIENSAIIGIAPEFVYTDGLSVEEVTIKFELENSVINNTLGTYTDESYEFKGIKRLNVFMFFEDVNMLLPVETFHDEEANTVYTKTDRVGTYCLVDMEIFLDNLDKQLNDNENEAKIEVQSEVSEAENTVDNNTVLSYNINKKDLLSNNSGNPDDFDVVFLIDCRSVSKDEEYAVIVRNVIETADTVFVKSPKARVRIIAMKSTAENPRYREVVRGDIMQCVGTETGSGYFYNVDEVYDALKFIKEHQKDVKGDCDVSSAIGRLYEINKYNPKQVYAFCIVQPEGSLQNVKDSNNVLKDIKEKGTIQINTVFLMEAKNENEFSYANKMINYTGGKAHFKYDDSSEFMLKQIYNNPEVNNGFRAITALGYKTVVLNQSLQDNYDMCQNKAHYDKHIDTDLDGLADYQEIMFSHGLIDDNDQSHIELLTFGQIIDNIVKMSRASGSDDELFYVEKGLDRYKGITGEDGKYPLSLWNVKILPIISDPTSEDGDGDGILDINEKWNGIDERYKNISPLKSDTVESLYPELQLNKIRGYNKETSGVYLDIKENNIVICCDIADIESSQLEVVKKALNEFWAKDFEGGLYDFYPGMKISTGIRLVHNNGTINVKFKQDENVSKRSYFNQITNTVHIFYVNDKSESMGTIAHEFGHVFKLNDAYPYNIMDLPLEILEKNLASNQGKTPLTIYNSGKDEEKNELWMAGEIMAVDKSVNINDIEMILQAFVENKRQSFVPTSTQKMSKAIKTPYIPFWDCKNHKLIYYDNSLSQYFDIERNYYEFKDESIDTFLEFAERDHGKDFIETIGSYAYWLEQVYGEKNILFSDLVNNSGIRRNWDA